ncbi:hypothetical protein EW146_g956 [Bondarzewia mesenterica]|uniref:SHSP domain-containing protein n=1 Tax=Bondarzewia mesenterica TaxID=1095465 RepID=A0A4S4M5W2_9AGAM|nr:hypothetical protein EW146_g956 [Bondarzewia mesenterica]
MLNQGGGFNQHSPSSDAPANPDNVAAPPNDASTSPPHVQHQEQHAATPNSVFPFGRPFSTPTAGSQPMVPQGRFNSPGASSPTWYDRTSTASLPPSSQTPYYTLPTMLPNSEGGRDVAQGASSTVGWTQDSSSNTRQPPAASSQNRVYSSSASTMSYAPPPPYTPHMSATAMDRATSEYSPVSPVDRRPPTPPPTNPSRTLPPPAPPTILAPPPATPGQMRNTAPHEPFLAHAPPPPDSWIAVETMPREYTLVVRLPGFARDGITLATRRRRILHLVADSWEPGGGHFERRISFGYDADLAQVRAEFDGELLRVIIPRRTPSLTWFGEARE